MTLRIFGFIITIDKMKKSTGLTIDQTRREEEVKAITSSESFQILKAQVLAARQNRGK